MFPRSSHHLLESRPIWVSAGSMILVDRCNLISVVFGQTSLTGRFGHEPRLIYLLLIVKVNVEDRIADTVLEPLTIIILTSEKFDRFLVEIEFLGLQSGTEVFLDELIDSFLVPFVDDLPRYLIGRHREGLLSKIIADQ